MLKPQNCKLETNALRFMQRLGNSILLMIPQSHMDYLHIMKYYNLGCIWLHRFIVSNLFFFYFISVAQTTRRFAKCQEEL